MYLTYIINTRRSSFRVTEKNLDFFIKAAFDQIEYYYCTTMTMCQQPTHIEHQGGAIQLVTETRICVFRRII